MTTPVPAERNFHRALLDISSDLLLVAAADGTVQYVNAAVEPILGYKPEEVIGRNGFSLVHPDDILKLRDLLDYTLGNPDEAVPACYRMRHKSGAWRQLEGIAVNRLGDSEVAGILINYRDVTELAELRAEYEKKVRESDARFHRLLESKLIGVVISTMDADILRANQFFLDLVGYTRKDLETGVLRNWKAITHPDSMAACQRAVEEIRLHGECKPFSKEFIRKDGQPVPVLVSSISIGEYLIGFISDLTEQKRAQEESARLAQIVNSTSDAVVMLSLEGNILTWNPAAETLFGYRAEEILGRPEAGLIPDDRQRDAVATLEAARRGETHENCETVRKHKDGHEVPVSITVAPVRDSHGRIVGLSKIARDLTGVKRAEELEEQVRQNQKLESIGRLAGGVAHDFNNILMVIMNYAQMLQDRLRETDPLRRNTREILVAAERAAAVTSQLLAFSRRQMLQPRILSLNVVIAEMLGMLRRLIGEDVNLAFHAGTKLGTIKADPGQFTQVLLNLCVNARDAMPRGGSITLETSQVYLDGSYCRSHPAVEPGMYVMLAISDTGEGMTPEVQNRIFEPFFTTKELGKGTGLGLATVYGIVKQSGGHIWVYSELGKGTTFKVYFPVVDEPASDDLAAGRSDMGCETLLVVEDENALRESTVEFLETCGYRVLSACDGAEALRVAEHHAGAIHVLVTDVVMPGMSGRQVADRLVGLRRGMKVLYLSGYTEDAISHRGILDSGVEFLQKPFALRVLAQKLRQLVRPPESAAVSPAALSPSGR